MKPEELRINNYIYNGIGEVFQVNQTTIGYFDIGQSTLGGFKPIPLTEKWLLDFGFEEYKIYDESEVYLYSDFELMEVDMMDDENPDVLIAVLTTKKIQGV